MSKRTTRWLSCFILLLLLFGQLPMLRAAAAEAPASDLDGNWARSTIEDWMDRGLVKGMPDGKFRPDNPISRAEFVALVNRYFQIADADSAPSFRDVKADHWFAEDVVAAVRAGYVSGYPNNEFKPLQSITREEAASIIAKLAPEEKGAPAASSFKDEAQIGRWSLDSVRKVASLGIMKGYPDQTFRPRNPITRAEAIVALNNVPAKRETAPVQAVVEGKVTRDGAPVQGTTVRLFAKDGLQPIRSAQSDEAGSFRFEVDPGTYDLTAESDVYVAYAAGVTAEAGSAPAGAAKLELVKGVKVGGKLLKSENEPLSDANLYWKAASAFVAKTGADGTFSIVVAPDRTYSLAYSTGAGQPLPIETPVSVQKDDVNVGNLYVTAPVVVSGGGSGGGGGSKNVAKITVSGTAYTEGNQPLAGKKIQFLTKSKSVAAEVTTDGEGYFVVKLAEKTEFTASAEGLTAKLTAQADNDIRLANETGRIELGKKIASGDNYATMQPGTIVLGTEQASRAEVNPDTLEVAFGKSPGLAKGDIFYLPPTEAYPGGLALKVKSVSAGSGGKTVVQTEKPTLEEVFAEIKGQTSEPLRAEDFIPEPGVTVLSAEPETQAFSAGKSAMSGEVRALGADEVTKIGFTIENSDEVNFSGTLELSGDVNGDIDWAWELDLVDSFDFSFQAKQVLKAEVFVELSPKDPLKKKLGTFRIPTSIPGATVDVPVVAVFTPEGKFGLEVQGSLNEQMGIRYDDKDGIRVYPEDKFQADFAIPQVVASGKLSFGLDIGEFVAAAGIDLIGISEEAGWFGEATGSLGSCLELKHGAYFKLAAESPLIDWKSAEFAKEFEFGKVPILGCSADVRFNPEELEMAPGDVKTFVLEKREGQGLWEPVSGDDLGEVTFSSSSPYVTSLGNGEFRAEPNAMQGDVATITAKMGSKTATAQIRIVDNRQQGTLVGKVTDAVTDEPIEGASIIVKLNGRSLKTAATQANGSYELQLPPGAYQVTFSSPEYMEETSFITIRAANVVTYDSKLQLIGDEYSGTGTVKGAITNALTGQPAPNIEMKIRAGRNNTTGDVAATAKTDENGQYSLELPAGNYTAELSGEGYITTSFNLISVGRIVRDNQNATISPEGVLDNSFRVVLSWGETPYDLDSHFTGPTESSSERFHIFFVNKDYSEGERSASLDVDDIDSYGPETVTTTNFKADGTYVYAVHNFSDRNATNGNTNLSNSNATVRVYSGNGLVAEFNVPLDKEGNVWRVFEIRGGAIVPINRVEYVSSWGSASDFAPEQQSAPGPQGLRANRAAEPPSRPEKE